MKLNYYQETDSLYIDLSDRTSIESKEVAPGVVVDFDVAGTLVGIDIANASKLLDLTNSRRHSIRTTTTDRLDQLP
jgi:uncharacterized protein YuzE